jgi:hypothetical protein
MLGTGISPFADCLPSFPFTQHQYYDTSILDTSHQFAVDTTHGTRNYSSQSDSVDVPCGVMLLSTLCLRLALLSTLMSAMVRSIGVIAPTHSHSHSHTGAGAGAGIGIPIEEFGVSARSHVRTESRPEGKHT